MCQLIIWCFSHHEFSPDKTKNFLNDNVNELFLIIIYDIDFSRELIQSIADTMFCIQFSLTTILIVDASFLNNFEYKNLIDFGIRETWKYHKDSNLFEWRNFNLFEYLFKKIN